MVLVWTENIKGINFMEVKGNFSEIFRSEDEKEVKK